MTLSKNGLNFLIILVIETLCLNLHLICLTTVMGEYSLLDWEVMGLNSGHTIPKV